MKLHKIAIDKTGQFSNLFVDYVNQKKELAAFYNLFPTKENIVKQSKLKSEVYPDKNRSILKQSLQKQYSKFNTTSLVNENINSLTNKNTFTITTGHQLNLFTGPLYSILKIATVIECCLQMNKAQSEFNYIPVFWMASEDHDKEEINHFHLFGKKYVWETEQTGPVGRFSTSGIETIFSEIKDKLPLLENAYLKQPNLASATRFLLNELFGEYGLVIIDGDDIELKSLAKELFKSELVDRLSKGEVDKSTAALENLGYSGQVFPREINLFYMETGLRERILFEEGRYKVNSTDKIFTQQEILEELNLSPEKFSPNVILRPVYQEIILPNVAYSGGPAEVCYWFQLKSVFEKLHIPFSVLLPRVFAMIIQKSQVGKMSKLGLSVDQLFEDEKVLKENLIASTSSNDFSLDKEELELDSLFNSVKDKASAIDPTLEAFVLAEAQKVKKIVEHIGKKLKKSEEQKHEVVLNQLSSLKSKLFPEGGLQERKDNFLNFYTNNPEVINEIIQSIDSLDLRFNVFIENE